MALSISDHCRSCIVSLQEVISILSQPDRNDNHVKPSQVCEELDRFSLFIGNIGALHRPESPLSIESRLQDANEVLTHILGLLTDLNDVTTELLDIVSGKREGMVTIADEAEDGEVISEANELREEVSETITRLFRVSILIRQAAPTDIFAKALSRNRYHFSDQFDIAHVGEKYRKLATEDYAWLRQRLGRAITQRRHYLSYIHDHREKLGGILNHQDKADTSAAKSQTPVIKQPLDPKPMLDAESRPSFFTKATTVAAERITPQLHVAGDSDPDEDARSYTTVSRSIDGDHESSTNVRIPKLDTLRADHRNEFECPFCFRIKKFKSERIWRKHVFADLRPYVCTFPDCDAPYFGDINKWFHHEMTLHRVTYNCFLCQKVYHQEGKYLFHLRQEHGGTLDDDGAQVGTELARKPLAQIPASDCPCCSDWADRLKERIIQTSGSAPTGILAVTPTVFKRHLAAHLEQLALFAVPIVTATDDNEDSNAAIEEARSKRTKASQVSALNFPSLPGDFDDSRSETEIDPSRNPIPRTDTQGTEINREYVDPSPNLIRKTASLPSDSSERRDQDSPMDPKTQANREIQLRNEIEANKKAHGDDHPDTLASRTALALYWQEHEQWIEAEDELYYVMEVTRRKLGHNHPDTLASMRHLAECYEKQTKWEPMNELLVKIMETRKTMLGHDHPDTLDSIKTLASRYMYQYRYEEALVLQRDAWAGYHNLFGPEALETLESQEQLAAILEYLKEYDEAEALQREAWAGFEKLFGPEGLHTLRSKEQLASILEGQNKDDEAEALQREVLEGYGHVSWPELTQILKSKEKLALILEGQKKYDEAEAIHREVLLQFEDTFGPEDIQTLTSKEQLARVLVNNGKHYEAEALQREAMTRFENVFGPEHVQTLVSTEKLALMLKEFGKLEEAEHVYKKALAASEMLFGFDTLHTVQLIDFLATLQRDLGRLEEEEALRREAARRYRKSLGSEHIETLAALRRLADALGNNMKFEEAENLLREVIKVNGKHFGPDSVFAMDIINDLESLLAEQGKFKEAEEVRREDVMALERVHGRDNPLILESITTLASTLSSHGKLKEAEELYGEVFDMRIRSDVPLSPPGPTLDIMARLASVQEKQEKFEAAESTYRQVLAILSRLDKELFAEVILEISSDLLRVLEKQGKDEEADDMRRQVEEAEQYVLLSKS